MPDAHLSDREWIAKNPTRFYRIVRRSAPNSTGVLDADITSISGDRHTWSKQRVIMRAELPDTDAAALLALEERNAVFVARVDR